jgi:hypothetical protein
MLADSRLHVETQTIRTLCATAAAPNHQPHWRHNRRQPTLWHKSRVGATRLHLSPKVGGKGSGG